MLLNGHRFLSLSCQVPCSFLEYVTKVVSFVVEWVRIMFSSLFLVVYMILGVEFYVPCNEIGQNMAF